MNPPFGWEEIKRFYGWEERYLTDLAAWETRMVLVKAPEGATFFYDKDTDGVHDPDETARGIRVHQAIAQELSDCLKLVFDAGLWRFVESMSGGYNFRTQRGSKKISMHALGAAVDFDARRNPLGRIPEETALGSEPGRGVVRIFEARGWRWGGEFSRPDSMHVQFGGGF